MRYLVDTIFSSKLIFASCAEFPSAGWLVWCDILPLCGKSTLLLYKARWRLSKPCLGKSFARNCSGVREKNIVSPKQCPTSTSEAMLLKAPRAGIRQACACPSLLRNSSPRFFPPNDARQIHLPTGARGDSLLRYCGQPLDRVAVCIKPFVSRYMPILDCSILRANNAYVDVRS